VEGAVGAVVGELLPGVITTTRHARMYSLHTLAWADARERGLDLATAEVQLRRMEAVIAAIHYVHKPHRVQLSVAHGEHNVPSFLDDGGFDVDAAAACGGLSRGGFAGVYQGPCVRIRALSADPYPHPGSLADVARVRQGLGDLVEMAGQSQLTVDERLRRRTCACAKRRGRQTARGCARCSSNCPATARAPAAAA